MRKLLAAGVIASSLFASTGAGAAVITFDDVAANTNIQNHYAGLGATFSTTRPGVFVAARSVGPGNLGVGFSDTGLFDEQIGIIRATFSSVLSSVSLDAISIESPEGFGFVDRAYIRAYDAGNNLIGEMFNSVTETWQTLTINGAISYIEFSATRTGGTPRVFGGFDNLNFTVANNPDPTPTPEPAALGLLGLGILSAAGLRRRKA